MGSIQIESKMSQKSHLEMVSMLDFVRKYGGWVSFTRDKINMKYITWLCSHGYIVVNRFDQMHAINQNGTLS